jgi:putative glycerol-1-phosphate prenyltransferase
MEIYQQITRAKLANKKLLAVLLDPINCRSKKWACWSRKSSNRPPHIFFVGGSHVVNDTIGQLIACIKQDCDLPVILFPETVSDFGSGRWHLVPVADFWAQPRLPDRASGECRSDP